MVMGPKFMLKFKTWQLVIKEVDLVPVVEGKKDKGLDQSIPR